MKYIGLQSQIWKNNTKSVLLLVLFPLEILALTWLFFYFTRNIETQGIEEVSMTWLYTFPWITVIVGLWFLIAWFSHTAMIRKATGSRPMERKENKKVYNMLENLSIAAGMKMPGLYIIEDDSLNAFASGIDRRSYSVHLSRGIINKLNDEELEGVIAHELTHIKNKDVRLLIISIVFVGIFAFISEGLMRSMYYGRISSGGNRKGGGQAVIIAMVLALVGWLLASLFRFALSRKREYLADAGAAELTKRPEALASALRKVSGDPTIEAVKRKDVAQMFIENPQLGLKKKRSFTLFATHPPIEKRIAILEQF